MGWYKPEKFFWFFVLFFFLISNWGDGDLDLKMKINLNPCLEMKGKPFRGLNRLDWQLSSHLPASETEIEYSNSAHK